LTKIVSRTRKSASEAVVSKVFIEEGQIAERGQPVLAIKSDEINRVQNEYLQKLISMGGVTWDDASLSVELAGLRHLKVADSQIREIAASGNILDPLPILCSHRSVIFDRAQLGALILKDGNLFAAVEWSLQVPPRGDSLWKTQEELSMQISRPIKAQVKKPPIPISNSEAEKAHRKAQRQLSSFESARPLKLAGPNGRHDLQLSMTQWRDIEIATVVAETREFKTTFKTVGQAEAAPAPDQLVDIVCPVAGQCTVEFQGRTKSLIRPGQVIARIAQPELKLQRDYLSSIGNEVAEATAKQALLAAGFTEMHINTMKQKGSPVDPVLLVARYSAVVAEIVALADESRRLGDVILRVDQLEGFVVKARLPKDQFARLPASIDLVVKLPSSKNIVFEAANCPLMEVNETNDHVTFCLPIESSGKPLAHGHVFDLEISIPGSARPFQVLPVDAKVRLGRSDEILLHIGPGRLLPARIIVEGEEGGLLKISNGVLDGYIAVRDLAMLMKSYPEINGIMTGFWDPEGNII
jgi:hypothetical protein